jgi:hypothetical protein
LIAIPIFFRAQIGRILHTIRGPKEEQTADDDRAGSD